jgi:hypothetical protein
VQAFPKPMMNPVKGDFLFHRYKKNYKQHKPNPDANIQFDMGNEGYVIVDPTLLISH